MARPIKAEDLTLYSMFSEPSFSPDGGKIAFSVRRANLQDDAYDSDVCIADLGTGKTETFTRGKKDVDPKWSPDGKYLLFTSKRNLAKEEKGNSLYVIPSAGGEARLIQRNKEGIDNPQWGPDSKTIFFSANVTKKEKDDVRVIRRLTFWFNGLGFIYNRRKHVFSVDLSSGKASQLTHGSFDVVDFAVSHDGKRLAYIANASDLKPYIVDLYVMEISTGKTRKLTKSNMELSTLTWSPDDSKVALAGDDLPAGFASHTRIWTVNVRSAKTELVDRVDRNKSNSLNSDVRAKSHGPGNIVWSQEGIYFLQADGGSVHVYLLSPGQKPELVLGGDRSVEGFDVQNRRVAFVAMDSAHLEELYLKDRKESRLTSMNERVYRDVKVVPSEAITYRATDGVTVEGWIMVPKARGKVPCILYVHGGPKTAFGHSYMHEFQAFAGAGYAVVYLNPRGSDGYSEKFADIRGRYGTRDFDDLMEGLDYALKAYPQIDGSRLAIAGGSYGGFMTNWTIGHTERFKAAVTDRSIASWISMWGTSDIGPYFTDDQIGGDPWNAEEKLLNDSPLRYVPAVKTPLMLVHSMEDYRCWMVEGLQFFTALKRLGKEAELVLFPGENHDLSRMGKPRHRVSRLKHYIRWFDEHLKR